MDTNTTSGSSDHGNRGLQIWNFKGKEVRQILEPDGRVGWVGTDIAARLGYKAPRHAVSRHCRGGTKRSIPSRSGMQEMTVIYESDVYRLIANSTLPEAVEFERWLFEEVLPSIRKTGRYETGDAGIAGMDWQTAIKAMAVVLSQIQVAVAPVSALAIKVEEQDQRIARLEVKRAKAKRRKPEYDETPPDGYFTLIKWAEKNQVPVPKGRSEGSIQGRKAAEIARRMRLYPIKVHPPGLPHPINSYEIRVLRAWREQFKNNNRAYYIMPQLFGLDWESVRN